MKFKSISYIQRDNAIYIYIYIYIYVCVLMKSFHGNVDCYINIAYFRIREGLIKKMYRMEIFKEV